ncbi:F0F1 ATP synthase subunit B [Candidatus Gottesmanbacteria bacterium]|nr:F0F1 ATP synthase subunit B [Candidatus Gottesmanbacteria bacterium]
MDKLGIEPSLLLAQVVNFSIIMFVLSRLLYKPVLAMLEKRRREIEEGLQLTAKMQEEEEKMAVKKQKLLEAARKEAAAIVEEAKRQGKDEEKEILALAHKEAAAIMEKGKAEVEHVRETMEKGIRKQSVTLAAGMAERLLARAMNSQDRHALLKKQISELERSV